MESSMGMSPSLTPYVKEGQQAIKQAKQWTKLNGKSYVNQKKPRRLLFHDTCLNQGVLPLRLLFELFLALEAEFH